MDKDVAVKKVRRMLARPVLARRGAWPDFVGRSHTRIYACIHADDEVRRFVGFFVSVPRVQLAQFVSHIHESVSGRRRSFQRVVTLIS